MPRATRGIYKRKDSPYWWVNIEVRGRRIRQSAGTTDHQEAVRLRDELRAQAWKETRPGAAHTLYAALVLWVKDKPRDAKRMREVAQVRDTFHDMPVAAVTAGVVLDKLGGLKPGTYNKLASVIRAALNLAHAREWMPSPPKIPRRKEPVSSFYVLTAAEWDRLRTELPEHIRHMAEFTLATGLRWSNVAGLQWRSVDLRRRVAWISADDAKGGAGIPVPLSDEAVAVLKAVHGSHDTHCFTYHGKPIRSAKTGFLAACARAGIIGLRWHDLRHTWASWHRANGTPDAVLQRLGGWKSKEMLDRYAHFDPDFVAGWRDNARAPIMKKAGEK